MALLLRQIIFSGMPSGNLTAAWRCSILCRVSIPLGFISPSLTLQRVYPIMSTKNVSISAAISRSDLENSGRKRVDSSPQHLLRYRHPYVGLLAEATPLFTVTAIHWWPLPPTELPSPVLLFYSHRHISFDQRAWRNIINLPHTETFILTVLIIPLNLLTNESVPQFIFITI